MKRIYIVNENWDNHSIYLARGWGITRDMAEASLVHFCGGVDINPALYNQKPHPRTQAFSARRDEIEIEAYNQAVKLGKPIAGICRGAQLINVLNGGSLWQDVNNHGGEHNILDAFTEEIRRVNSVHHQMMIPCEDSVIVAYCNEATRKERVDVNGEIEHDVKSGIQTPRDCEIVYYPKTKSLCFQAHPEFDGMTAKVYFHYLDKYLGV